VEARFASAKAAIGRRYRYSDTSTLAHLHLVLPTSMTARRVLLIQLRRIGDVLMTTAAVRALREAWPEADLTYLTETPSQEVFANSPRVDRILLYPRAGGLLGHLRMMARLRRERFDVVVDFFSNPRSAQLAWSSGAPRRIGFGYPGRRWAYTDRVAPPAGLRYAAADKVALLAPLGVRAASLLPEVFLSDTDRAQAREQVAALGVQPGELLVGLCPVSRQPYKVWPAPHFARLADALIERYGAKVLLFWGPGEEAFVHAVRAHMVHHALPDYPVPRLPLMAALLERCHLYVGNDNGPRHFAIAVGTPTVAVFGKPHPESWTPPGDPRHRAIARDPGCKAHCTYPRCGLECIRDVPYGAVEREIESLLELLLRDGIPDRR
jgi:ADP-heptose:LPS heptosyltransferase